VCVHGVYGCALCLYKFGSIFMITGSILLGGVGCLCGGVRGALKRDERD